MTGLAKMVGVGFAVFLCLSVGHMQAYAAEQDSVAAGAVNMEDKPLVAAISEVFGDGEHLSAVILAYDKPILGSSVSSDDFQVTDRLIENAYVSQLPEKGNKGEAAGKYIVLELEPLPLVEQGVEAHSAKDRAEREEKGFHGPTLGSHGNPQPLVPVRAEVRQKGLVKAEDGTLYPPIEKLSSSHTCQLLIENFVQDTFEDEQQGKAKLMYNLYIPENIDSQKNYPLVVFMHDAGTVSPEIKATLSQGRGAVVWASKEWQEKHPCFVLAPQYDTVIVDDNYQYGPELDRTIHLIEYLANKYPIDRNRIYNTGQSMGGMTAIAMDVKYPDFFAASYLVACKWDAKVTAPLGSQQIWAVAAEGDPGAAPSMQEILGNLEQDGHKVLRMTAALEQGEDCINKAAAALVQPDCHLYYTLYTGGSHRSTWQHAYDLWPAMEWIFKQKK